MLFSKDRIGGTLLLAFCITYGILSQNITLLPIQAKAAFTARTMPEVLMVLGIGLSVLVLIFPGSNERPQLAGFNWGKAALFLALMSAYGLTIRPLGFLISTSLFLIAGFALLGERSPVKLLLVSVPLVVCFWLLMTQGLDVFIEPLPWFLKG
ncbi:tripartite tricarboxylate transporter TctB family protein [Hoeflea poritis]|uniref:Tripartite tricarboxylate transporter TctB family protein n=1 Tax=Hoeflea poritis TaxID=2993659 RepID=A0ABT4VVI7_9HYPH|nr:tripartite tricarboxylate transporter TctB family protein [Hoeflea poritis]MDA4848032.1 tripartite tricarboxylate transporter TctB family protein [Hoeflea poritis]